MFDISWQAAAVAIAGMTFTFGIISRQKVSKDECDERHKRTDEGVGELEEITARLDERVKTLYSLQGEQGKLMERQLAVVENLERIVRENGRH